MAKKAGPRKAAAGKRAATKKAARRSPPRSGPPVDASDANAEAKPPLGAFAPALDPFDPPAILSDVGAAKWRELAPELQALRDRQGQPLLDLPTRDLLASYCLAWESLESATKALRAAAKKGLEYLPNRAGGLTPHPAFSIRKTAQAELRSAGKLLGLNPDARHKLKPSKAEDKAADPVGDIVGD